MTKTIAILGANGRLSRCAAKAFHKAGWKVRAVTRSGQSVLGDEVETVAADMLVAEEVLRVTRDCDFIFNGLNPKYTDWHRHGMMLARNVMEAAKTNGCVHLFPGNVYNYGSQIPEVVTAATPFDGDHRKAAIRIEMESLFERYAKEEDVQTVILRAGDFYGGSGRGSWFDLVITASVEKGKVTIPGDRNLVHTWAYLPDLAAAFVQLAETAGELKPFEHFLFEGHQMTGEELHIAIEKALGRKLKRGNMPLWVLRVGGLFYPLWRETWEVSYLWRRPHRLQDNRLTQIIGPLQSTPLETALGQALGDLEIKIAPQRPNPNTMASMAA